MQTRRVEIESEVQHGTHTPASQSKTIAEIADDWLVEKESVDQIERSTLKSYRNHVNGYIKPFFGTLKLSELTTPRVAKFKVHLSRKCRTLTMARMVLSSFKALIAFAKVSGAISSNPTLEVKFGIDKKRDKPQIEVGKDVPSKSEIQAIIESATGRWRPLLITAIFTGMRSSELRGLRWSDVNWESRYISVTQRADEFGEIGSPKSKKGRRQIPMSKMVVNALKEWKLRCPKSVLDLVFPNGAGNIEYHTNIVHRGFGELQDKLGMVDEHGKPKYGMHALRHFCASHWLDLGVKPMQVQEWLGHSSYNVTMNVYGHLFPKEDHHDTLDAGELAIVGG